MADVVLVSMPFGPIFSPSIGLSLLEAGLRHRGIASRIEYFTIPFAEIIGQAFYSGIANGDNPALTDLVGEWMFSGALFGGNRARYSQYVTEVLRKRGTGPGSDEEPYTPAVIARIRRSRAKAPPFLATCLKRALRGDPKVVGFTSVSQQHVASLALARRIKRASPSTFIVFGGANCEGVMGYETVRRFPFVDAAVSGEGDIVFPELVRRVLDAEPVSDLPGVWTRARVEAPSTAGALDNAPAVRDLDTLPLPDFADFFRQFQASRYDRAWRPRLFFETSRGCWWGERERCTFCSLNGSATAFRSKSAARALAELSTILARHPGCDVQAVDNILDINYFKDFVPALASRRPKARLFYETKSNLKKEQVRLLRQAGIVQIQPGIESFSDRVLGIMRKGVTGLQNIQLLKWCKELGVEPSWNILWGFPGEPPEEYGRMARLVPLLTHLPPPVSADDVRLDRFSPMFDNAARAGLTGVLPLPAYRHIYHLPRRAVANLACYFSFRYARPQHVREYVQPLAEQVQRWKRVADRSDLFAVDDGRRLLIWDLRPVRVATLTILTGSDKVLYNACDAVCDRARLVEIATAAAQPGLSAEDVDRALALLVDRGLMVRDGSRYLALAIKLGDYFPRPPVLREFRRAVRRLGIVTRTPIRKLGASQFVVGDEGQFVIHAVGNPRQRERRS